MIQQPNNTLRHCSSCEIVMGKLIKQSIDHMPYWRTEPDSGNGQCTDCIKHNVPKPAHSIIVRLAKSKSVIGTCVGCGARVEGRHQRCPSCDRKRKAEHNRNQRALRMARRNHEN